MIFRPWDTSPRYTLTGKIISLARSWMKVKTTENTDWMASAGGACEPIDLLLSARAGGCRLHIFRCTFTFVTCESPRRPAILIELDKCMPGEVNITIAFYLYADCEILCVCTPLLSDSDLSFCSTRSWIIIKMRLKILFDWRIAKIVDKWFGLSLFFFYLIKLLIKKINTLWKLVKEPEFSQRLVTRFDVVVGQNF